LLVWTWARTVINIVTVERLICRYMSNQRVQEKIVGACEDQETAFTGLDVATSSSFRVCAYGNELDLSGYKTAINGPESKPERVIVRVS
jgi:hypothetical protein